MAMSFSTSASRPRVPVSSGESIFAQDLNLFRQISPVLEVPGFALLTPKVRARERNRHLEAYAISIRGTAAPELNTAGEAIRSVLFRRDALPVWMID